MLESIIGPIRPLVGVLLKPQSMFHDFLHVKKNVSGTIVTDAVILTIFYSPTQFTKRLHRLSNHESHEVPLVAAYLPGFIILMQLLECRFAALLEGEVKLTDNQAVCHPASIGKEP